MQPLRLSLIGVCLIVSVSGAQSPCTITGAGSTLEQSRAQSACDRAEGRFSLLFGEAAPAGELVLSDTLHGFAFEFQPSGWRLHWPTRTAPTEGQDQALAEDHHWGFTLPHELGHAMLAAFVEPGAAQPATRYGTVLPDWLDEAVAIWMEPADARASELKALFREHREAPSIAQFMQQVHPKQGDTLQAHTTSTSTWYPCPSRDACPDRPRWNESMQVRSWTRSDGSVGVDTTFYSGTPPEAEPLARAFYPFSLLLLEYVFERGGSAAVRELAVQLTSQPASAAVLVGPGRLASDAVALEAAWQRWFVERARR